jgi:hypothetical protein
VPIRKSDEPAPGDALSAEEQAAEEARAKVRAALHFGGEILEVPPTRWLLTGVFPEQGLGAIYGAPGGGKSFVAVHLAFEAATGGRFFGEAFPRPLRVVYVAAERPADTRDRIEAQAKHRAIAVPDTLALLAPRQPLQIEADFEHLRYALQEVAAERWGGAAPDLVIFDTFARMTLGHEENAVKEMGPVIAAFGDLVTGCGAAFGLLVHHSGKDTTKGLRGSSALLGALDVVLHLEGKPDRLALVCEKINAGKQPLPAYFAVQDQAIPDPADTGGDGVRALRNVGVCVAGTYREHAEGLEAEVLATLRDKCDNLASVTELAEACESKPQKWAVQRALKHLAEQRPPAVEKRGAGRSTKWAILETDPLGLEG